MHDPGQMRIFTVLHKAQILELRWAGEKFYPTQLFYNYDIMDHKREGLIVGDCDLKHAKRHNRYKGTLYIKARTKKRGLYEINLPGTTIKEMGRNVYWFAHKGGSSLHLLPGEI
jgi:hypothetical protein